MRHTDLHVSTVTAFTLHACHMHAAPWLQESLLHWAIEHSDPAVLAEKAGRKEKGQEEVVKEFLERKQRVKEVRARVHCNHFHGALGRTLARDSCAVGAFDG